MRRVPKLISSCVGAVAVVLTASACGTERINVPAKLDGGTLHTGAVLFSQRCAGCHTLSYAGTHGSAYNVRTAQYNNGPNFDIRCERPVARVLYAIENGGFSGAIMPQNIVVGQQAKEVAMFVATYSGRKAPLVPGVPNCAHKVVGTIPALGATGTTGGTGTAAATAQAKQAGKVTSQAGGKPKGSKAAGKQKGKNPSTGKGQGLGPG